MAVYPSPVRLEQRLRVKIGEAKNLLPRNHGSIGQRDTYCIISLDQEEIFRSTTVEKTLNPFFCEEFQCDIPREFRCLSFYLHDRDRTMKPDKTLGKVSIKKEDLHRYHGKDAWFHIMPVDPDSEVQGKIHVTLRLLYVQPMNDSLPQPVIEFKLIECSDLSIINGSCDPYATVTMLYSNGKEESRKTKVRKKTICPQFDDVFRFELPRNRSISQEQENTTYSLVDTLPTFSEIRVMLWHELSGMFGSAFLGEVRIPLRQLGSELLKEHSAWYFLGPRGCFEKAPKAELGSLRLKIHYTSDQVFPSHYYDTLRKILLNNCSTEKVTTSIGWVLGEIVSHKSDVAQPLTKIYLHHGQIVPFIYSLAKQELSSIVDTSTIFRGNTLVSKCMDELMKLVGHHYLCTTLKPTVEAVIKEKKACEIDPSRMSPTDSRDANLVNLRDYTSQIFRAINSSGLSCPPIMCQVFSRLRELANSLFPNEREVKYSVISSFIFLRFFAPAILGPKLFDIVAEHVDSSTHRTLTLLSKTVQTVGNLVSSRNPCHVFKEPYMKDLLKMCITDKMVDSVRTFLEIISSMPNGGQKAYEEPVVLKEGILVKRAQGRRKFGLKNFKARHFKLTTNDLTYSKVKGGNPLCVIPVEQILAVERVQESSFKCQNMFQLVHQQQRTLYMQAPNCVEEKEWLDLLTKVCQYNSHRLKQYHPGAYINSHWLCCKALNENAPGCSAVSNYWECELKVHIDSDREMERIYCLLMENMDRLEKLHNACENAAKYGGPRDAVISGVVLEDPSKTFNCLSAVITHVIHLDQEHRNYQRRFLRSTKYGSKQAPIGDDNYLLLASSIAKFDSQASSAEVNSVIVRKTASSPC